MSRNARPFIFYESYMKPICVCSTFYNPTNSQLRIDNYKRFLSFIEHSNLADDFYVVEILLPDQQSILQGKSVYSVVSDSVLWHKESGLNYLFKKIQHDYEKVVVADTDVDLPDGWVDQAIESLDKYEMVQLFSHINYLGPDNIVNEDIFKGVVYLSTMDHNSLGGNSGAIVAYNMNYIKYMGGLFDKTLVGGGDYINILPFIEFTKIKNIFEYFFDDICGEFLNYYARAFYYLNYISKKQKCGYLDVSANHYFHGKLNKRQYGVRNNIINKESFKDNITIDANGLYCFIDNNCNLSQKIKEYFTNRCDNIELKNYDIYSNALYETENNSYAWLRKAGVFFIKNNLYGIKLIVEKNENIRNFKVYCAEKEVCGIDNNTTIVYKIKGSPSHVMIDSDYFIPDIVMGNGDTRKLSYKLIEVNIKRTQDSEWENYPLDKIL